jgi:hypothetical protein
MNTSSTNLYPFERFACFTRYSSFDILQNDKSFTVVYVADINGQDRVLNPVYQLTQSCLVGNPDWKIYHYVWEENPQQYD